MKIRITLLRWATAALLVAAASGQQGPTTLANGGFENWSGGLPSGWSQENAVRDRGSTEADERVRAGGSRSLRLRPNSRNTNANQPYGVGQEILADRFRDGGARVSVAIRGEGGAEGALLILPMTRDRRGLGARFLAPQGGSADFERLEERIEVPGDAHSLIIACLTTSTSGSVWFDDVRVEPPDAAPAAAARSSRPETSAPAAAAEVVFEETFESWSGALPPNWVQQDRIRNRGAASKETSRTASGRFALKLAPNSRNTNPSEPYGIATIASAESLRGRQLTIEARMAAEGGASPVVLFLVRAKGDQVLKTVLVAVESPSGDYQTARQTVDVPSNAHDFILGLVVNGASGAAWFDDVRVADGRIDGAAAAGPAPLAAPSGSAKTVIDASRVVREIPRRLFGYNLGWVWNGEGVWDEKKDDFNQAVVESLKSLNPGPIRFPQGSYADFYHWRDGVGPRDKRPVRPHHTDENRSKNLFGTDEFMELCRRVDAEPMLQVNIITGSPEEAAAWVSYCNDPANPERIANGRREPYNVKLWEIGNEQYMKTENARLKRTELSPQEYVERFRRFAAAMKAVDPTIEIGAVGGKNFERYQLVRDDRWNKVVLGAIAGEIDFFAVHNAYAPALASRAGRSTMEVYRALLAFPEQVKRNLDEVAAQIRLHGGDPDVAIAVTEWGPFFHILPNDPFVDHPKTLGSGLYTAALLQKFIESEQTGIANFFKATEHAFMSAVGNDGVIKPSGYALMMFTEHFGSRAVASETAGPTYSSPAVGNVAAEAAAPFVTTTAALGADGSRLYVMAVNRSFEAPVDLELDIRGFSPRSEANVVTLTGPGIDAHNGDDLPQVPGIEWARQRRAEMNSAWDRGRPDLVAPRQSTLSNAAERFTVELAPMSVTSIELRAR